MTSARDVDAWLRDQGVENEYCVQKLLYYCQAWSLVWDGVPLFPDEIQAWADGPVCVNSWARRGPDGEATKLSASQVDTVRAVFTFYGTRSKTWLINLTHREKPWIDARGGALPGARTSTPITAEAMKAFYVGYGVKGKGFSPEFQEALDFIANEPDGLSPIESEDVLDAEPFLQWLETGRGDPWVGEGSST